MSNYNAKLTFFVYFRNLLFWGFFATAFQKIFFILIFKSLHALNRNDITFINGLMPKPNII